MMVEAGDIGHGALHDWFIPTRVGQTVTPPGGVVLDPGSSPRVWGGRAMKLVAIKAIAVHPHACGADANVARRIHWRLRFIPTRVGRTAFSSRPC